MFLAATTVLLVIATVIFTILAGTFKPVAPGSPISAMNGWAIHGLPRAQLDEQLAAMEARGVKVFRDDASWRSIEPLAPGPRGPVYRFGGEDAEVAALAAHHLTWLPVIDYSALWAGSRTGDWRSPPAHDAQFAAFAAAVASRYGAGGRFWALHPRLPYLPIRMYEIWNEENGDYFWDSGPNPTAYAELYLTARAAIHHVDARAQVVIGGLTNPQQGISADQFVTEMFQRVPALRGNVDGVGLHPYAATASGVVQVVRSFRTALAALGAGSVPIEATEFGWTTGNAIQEQSRAAMMRTVALALGRSNCGIGLVAPYDWENPGGSLSGGDWGLAGASGLRPAGAAWLAGLRSAAQRHSQALLCSPPAGSQNRKQ